MELKDFFAKYPSAAVAFSGGVDSAYLLYAAKESGVYQGNNSIRAYYVNSAFQPAFELEDAKRMADFLQIKLTIIPAEVLQDSDITANPGNRCYFCKKRIFSTIQKQAYEDGVEALFDGTNASDDVNDRPGMKALKELSVYSPLRECGLTKERIRELSKKAGLFTWDKPSYACLATRIPTGSPITLEKLQKTERGEEYLRSLGFTDFRIRMTNQGAKIQICNDQFQKLLEHRKEIADRLKQDYQSVTLDLEARNEE